jgi:hypothetical protein
MVLDGVVVGATGVAGHMTALDGGTFQPATVVWQGGTASTRPAPRHDEPVGRRRHGRDSDR